MRKHYVIFLLLSLLLFILYCSKESEITGEEKEKIVQNTEPLVARILEGFNEDNYLIFSKPFDERMKKGLKEEMFHKTRADIFSKIGLYISKRSPKVFSKAPFITVIYKADFEKEKDVNVRVIFQKYNKKYLVSGLWFNSPKLRGK